MKATSAESLIPIVSGLLIAALLVIIGWQFVLATQASTNEARDRIIATHNEIAQLPQPMDIDLGVQSGTITGQLENYQTAENMYKDLTFYAPPHTRQKIVGWLTFKHILKTSVNADDLANDYESFINTYSALLTTLKKPLVYDPKTDLRELSPGSNEFQQRVSRAGEGMLSAQEKINKLQLPPATKDAINNELTVLVDASEALLTDGNMSTWVKQVDVSQTAIRRTMQEYWTKRIAALSKRKQQLVSYYVHLYQ